MTTVKYTKKCVLGNKFQCTRCGKTVYAFNLYEKEDVCATMLKEHICWDCAYWEWFKNNLPEHLEIIGNRCYQVLPFVESVNFTQMLGGGGKTKYLLKRDGTCIRSNDIWWIGVVPFQFQDILQPTGWWTTRKVFKSLNRSQRKCTAKGCLDRYHCYRYKYQTEFDKEPYNKVPLDWTIGGEKCPAFISLHEIKDYDEYVKPSDIIDESSVIHNKKNYEAIKKWSVQD